MATDPRHTGTVTGTVTSSSFRLDLLMMVLMGLGELGGRRED